MTTDEHQLVVYMLQEQQKSLVALIESLKSRGVIQDGDLVAHGLVLHSEGKTQRIEDRVEEDYRARAASLGIALGEFSPEP